VAAQSLIRTVDNRGGFVESNEMMPRAMEPKLVPSPQSCNELAIPIDGFGQKIIRSGNYSAPRNEGAGDANLRCLRGDHLDRGDTALGHEQR